MEKFFKVGMVASENDLLIFSRNLNYIIPIFLVSNVTFEGMK